MKRPTDEEYILLAYNQYANDEHEFTNVYHVVGKAIVGDPRPVVSAPDDNTGAWVQGWYWVANPNFDEEEQPVRCEDCLTTFDLNTLEDKDKCPDCGGKVYFV